MNRPVRLFVGIFLLLLMGFIDYVTGRDFAFSIFYLVPIFIVAWYSGKRDGIFMAFLGSVVWLVVDTMGGIGNTDAVAIWNGLVRFGFFIIVVYLTHRVKKLNDELEEKVIARTADLLAEISEREKTEQELKTITEKLRKLTRRIQVIREEENKIIAREIHDELGQALTAIKIDVAWLSKRCSNDQSIVESLVAILNSIDDTIKTVRKISTRLRPRLLDELGLIPAIEWQVKEFQSRTGIDCSLVLPEENFDIGFNASSSIFRIFQEAITNVSRHSRAASVCIEISLNGGGTFTMLIKDNGIGLPENYLHKEQSLGILSMKERAHSVGGSVKLQSVPGGGTEVLVEIPFKTKNI